MTAIAAIAIGGASLTGGRGTVAGAMMGVLILGLLANGVSLFNVLVEVRYILEGGIILLNAALSWWPRPEANSGPSQLAEPAYLLLPRGKVYPPRPNSVKPPPDLLDYRILAVRLEANK